MNIVMEDTCVPFINDDVLILHNHMCLVRKHGVLKW